jgi:hypothetical protein
MLGVVFAEMLGCASTNLVFLFLIGLRLRLRLCFLLLALLALSQIPCKKPLEFLIL